MMKKYTFDAKNGLWYEQCREYQLSCLTVPNSKPIGIGGPVSYTHLIVWCRIVCMKAISTVS